MNIDKLKIDNRKLEMQIDDMIIDINFSYYDKSEVVLKKGIESVNLDIVFNQDILQLLIDKIKEKPELMKTLQEVQKIQDDGYCKTNYKAFSTLITDGLKTDTLDKKLKTIKAFSKRQKNIKDMKSRINEFFNDSNNDCQIKTIGGNTYLIYEEGYGTDSEFYIIRFTKDNCEMFYTKNFNVIHKLLIDKKESIGKLNETEMKKIQELKGSNILIKLKGLVFELDETKRKLFENYLTIKMI